MSVSRGWVNEDLGRKWTKEERNAMAKMTYKAIRDGVIPSPQERGCNRCGQRDGIIHYHNHCYDHPTDFLEPLCWRCHLILHSWHRSPEACQKYWDLIADGFRFSPVFKNDLGILWREHGIR